MRPAQYTDRTPASATPSQSSARDTASPAADTIPPPRSESSSTTPTQTPEFEHLSYHVHRTPSQELPVYHSKKGGGTLLQTLLRKIDGDRRALIQDLVPALGIEETDIKVNAVNGHVVIKVSESRSPSASAGGERHETQERESEADERDCRAGGRKT